MTKREVVRAVLRHERPPYVPWSFRFTLEARDKLVAHFGAAELEARLEDHFLELGADVGIFTEAGEDRVRDVFGVVWNRSVDKDIGIVEGLALPEPTLAGYTFPDPHDPRFFDDIPERIARTPDRFRVFCLGFSLFERAWTLRGMENLFIDFHESPEFVHDLLARIADYNIAQIRKALTYDIDAVCFGDDWGQQRGLLMGQKHWKSFLRPQLDRLYREVCAAGKFVLIHSCGDVDELFDELIALGLDCFNPFQPEVMDVDTVLPAYRSRLSFWGGLSTQRTLPFGTVEDVRRATLRLIELGSPGGLILSPAHAIEQDVPLENMLALIDTVRAQQGVEAIAG